MCESLWDVYSVFDVLYQKVRNLQHASYNLLVRNNHFVLGHKTSSHKIITMKLHGLFVAAFAATKSIGKANGEEVVQSQRKERIFRHGNETLSYPSRRHHLRRFFL